MARRKITAGSTSETVPIFIRDTSSTTGGGLGSLVYNTAGLAAEYRRQGQSSWTAITLVTATLGTFTSGGFIVDGASVTGSYEVGIPDAALAAGAKWVVVRYYGAANMMPVLLEIQLDVLNYQGTPDVNVTEISGTTQTAADLGAINVANLNTLSGHDPGATLGTSTLTQAQVSGGAYAINDASFAFNAALDFTTTQKTSLNAATPQDSSGVTTLLSRLPAGIFTGMTSLAQWLGLLAGKQAGNATARTEIRATGAGSGTFDETTDSQEALRDQGDLAWITATGFSTLDAAGVRDAVGLAAADLDTQFGDITTSLTTIEGQATNKPTRGVSFTPYFVMVDSSDLSTALSGLTVTVTVSKDGGAFAAATNSAVEISGGFYQITLTATEMTADVVAVKCTATGAAQRSFAIVTQPG